MRFFDTQSRAGWRRDRFAFLVVALAAAFVFPAAAPTPAVAKSKKVSPCVDMTRAVCKLKGTYRFTGADGAAYALSGNLVVNQTKKKLQVAGLLRYTQEGGTAPAEGTTVRLTVAYMTDRIGCTPGEGGISRTLLDATAVPLVLEDTPLDEDVLLDEYSAKVTPKKSTQSLATIVADLRAAGARTGEIVLLLDGGSACAILATRR
jgi:hypothetical protein